MIYGNLFSDSDNEKYVLLCTCSHKCVSLGCILEYNRTEML